MIFLLLFLPYLSCLQNNPPENNVEPVPAKSEPVQLCGCVGFCCCGSRQIWAASKIIRRKIMWNSSRQIWAASKTICWKIMWKIWRELVLHYFPSGLFWGRFLLDLRSFFGARFRYKLIYYYFYHRSDLRKIIQFLHNIECIKFECNKFVLVLVQIDLIHFEHSICNSST